MCRRLSLRSAGSTKLGRTWRRMKQPTVSVKQPSAMRSRRFSSSEAPRKAMGSVLRGVGTSLTAWPKCAAQSRQKLVFFCDGALGQGDDRVRRALRAQIRKHVLETDPRRDLALGPPPPIRRHSSALLLVERIHRQNYRLRSMHCKARSITRGRSNVPLGAKREHRRRQLHSEGGKEAPADVMTERNEAAPTRSSSLEGRRPISRRDFARGFMVASSAPSNEREHDRQLGTVCEEVS
jgi:hypothetical protein